MSIDLVALIKHSLSVDKLVGLPEIINTWHDISDFSSTNEAALWSFHEDEPDLKFGKEELQTVWQYCVDDKKMSRQQAELFQNLHPDPAITCNFGIVYVLENTLLIKHWNCRYSKLRDPSSAKKILTLNRVIARHLNQNEVMYFPDSIYKTCLIDNLVWEGKTYSEIKRVAVEKFGVPPKGIEDGRKNMFFFDDLIEDIQLSEWDGVSPRWD